MCLFSYDIQAPIRSLCVIAKGGFQFLVNTRHPLPFPRKVSYNRHTRNDSIMEQSTAAHPSTDTTLPEKPAAVQHSMPQHTVSQAAGQQPHFQPYELPKVEPFRPSKPFSVAKVTIASCNVIFAITALGLAVGLICVDWAYDSILGDIIAAAAVSVKTRTDAQFLNPSTAAQQ